MKFLIHKNDGNSPIQVPVIKIAESELMSLEEMKKNIPIELEPTIVSSNKLPPDDRFIMAWKLEKGVVSIDLDKAKELKKNHLRSERVPFLANLDVEFQRALETGADTTAIVAEKNRLRDITLLVDSASTIEELISITLDSK